jgi:hypothetical protein
LNNTCDYCTSPCKTCTTIATNTCTSCVDGFYLNTSECFNCTGLCLTCDTSATDCKSCVDGYYFKDTGDSNNCKPCVYPCVNCYASD